MTSHFRGGKEVKILPQEKQKRNDMKAWHKWGTGVYISWNMRDVIYEEYILNKCTWLCENPKHDAPEDQLANVSEAIP